MGSEGGIGYFRAVGADTKARIGAPQSVQAGSTGAALCHLTGVVEGPVRGKVVGRSGCVEV